MILDAAHFCTFLHMVKFFFCPKMPKIGKKWRFFCVFLSILSQKKKARAKKIFLVKNRHF